MNTERATRLAATEAAAASLLAIDDVYQVHYFADDAARTPGKCRTDHRVEVGDTIYTQNGRATVRSCRLMRPAQMGLVGTTRTFGTIDLV